MKLSSNLCLSTGKKTFFKNLFIYFYVYEYTAAVQMVVSLHLIAGNWSRNLCSLQPKDLFIIICKYTVAVFIYSRRGSQILLWMVVSHHVVAGNWTQDLCSVRPCSLQPKDLFIIICKYVVAVFRHSRRGHQISLQMVVSHHVVAGIWTQDLWT